MKKLLTLIMLYTCWSCQEEVDFDTTNRSLLIVDGFITDADRVHTIRLATSAEFTSRFEGGLEEPVTNAAVSIESGSGESVLLIESAPGMYDTPNGYRAQTGETYVLCITTVEGEHYQSRRQQLIPSGEMGEIFYSFSQEEVELADNTTITENRINFFSNFTFPDDDYYYKWEWDGVYMMRTTYLEDEERVEERCAPRTPDIPEFCFVNDVQDSEYIRVLDSNSSSQLTHNNFLVLSRILDSRWGKRYSIRLYQYAITEEAFAFWEAANQQREQTGSIFDPTPAKITGNMFNVDNRSEDVLGFFGVYGSQEVKLFVSGGGSGAPGSCFKPLILPDETHPPYCCDCREFDLDRSKVEKPDFWID